MQGIPEDLADQQKCGENFSAPRHQHARDLHALSGRQLPVKGEHCAWMESSAVVYCNSVIGARTNTEGRESTSAAMLTGKIPDWGFIAKNTATARI